MSDRLMRPPIRQRLVLGLLAVLSSLLVPEALSAGTSAVYPDDTLIEQLPRGERVTIYGKYRGLVEDELQLIGVPMVFSLKSKSIARKLLELQPKRDNVAVSGIIREERDTQGMPVLDVDEIAAAPSDVELFTDRLKVVFSHAERQSGDLIRIARAIRAVQEFAPQGALDLLLEKAVFEAFRLAQRRLDTEDADAHYRLAKKLYKAVPNRRIHAEILKREAIRFPGHEGFESRLKKLGFRLVNGKWLEYEAFKQLEGFVRYEDLWVKKHDREFLEFIRSVVESDRTNEILRGRTDRGYRELAKTGQIVRGMNRQEVATANGLPDRVRRRFIQKLGFDQWDFGDIRVYFVNGLVSKIEGEASSSAIEAIIGND